MGGAINIDTVSLVSIFTECTLYGYFSVLFVVALYVLTNKRAKYQKLNKSMVTVSVVMFILATIHAGIDLRRVLDAFINNPEGAIPSLSSVNTVPYLIKSTAYTLQTLVGDGFVVYRLYKVWNGKKLVVLPVFLTFLASIGVGIGTLQTFARVSANTPVFITQLGHWIVSFFVLTLFTNITCTSLIAARIWWIHRQTLGLRIGGHSLVPAAVVIVESGAIYSAVLIILIALYLSGSFAQYIALDAVSHVIGIVFSLIIVRVGLGLSSEQAEGKSTKATALFLPSTTDSSRRQQSERSIYPMHDMSIKIESTTQHDSMITDFQGASRFESQSYQLKDV